MQPEQLTFSVDNRTIAAQRWGDPNGIPVIALHGWLDNSASFFRLGPLLKNVCLVALDMAGHGQSDHRPELRPYNIWEDVGELFSVADQLGWLQFSLLGHSRGAIVSMLAAGTFPERVISLGLLDGIWPEPVLAVNSPMQLARSILELQNLRPPRVYSNREKMIEVRMNSFWTLSRDAAQALVERGTRSVNSGYIWSSDPKLSVASAFKLTQLHIDAFLENVDAPIRLLLAQSGFASRMVEALDSLDRIASTVLPGGHHFHMEAQADTIAELLSDFYGEYLSLASC